MISDSEIFLGIVALKPIGPHEQVLLDYCGVVPQERKSHLGILKICRCNTCCPHGKSPLIKTRQTRLRISAKDKLSIRDSIEKWNKAGRCPDMGAFSSSASSESSLPSSEDDLKPTLVSELAQSSSPTPDFSHQDPPAPPKSHNATRTKQKASKTSRNKLLTFRDIDKDRDPPAT